MRAKRAPKVKRECPHRGGIGKKKAARRRPFEDRARLARGELPIRRSDERRARSPSSAAAVGGQRQRDEPPARTAVVPSLLTRRDTVPYIAVRLDRLYWYVALMLSTVVESAPTFGSTLLRS